ncbi:T6SS immunity protein Tdi1 domain-containing protein [Kitasatospora sp. NPDC096128]|uniref:T6SS immunity protein Tdi1 domain-containing protein n=1 Tax=Kitasatospora sp. NPDC096128 TaxID=3155547 RepID=UPI00331B7ADB
MITEFSVAALQERMPTEAARSLAALGPGTHFDGFLHLVAPDLLDETLAEWLGGFNPSRTPFARTALGDIIYVRDLRERARALGLDDAEAEAAHDVSVLDVRFKRTSVLGFTFGDFASRLSDPTWPAAELRKDLYDAAVGRLGQPGFDEIFTFVPALAAGGSQDPGTLERNQADVALSILLQT